MTAPTINTLVNGSGSDVTNATSYTTGSITATAGRPLLAAIVNTKTGSGDQPSLSGWGATWSVVNTVTNGVYRITVLKGITPSSGAATGTIDYGGVTQNNSHWHIVEVQNGENTFLTVQSSTNTGGSGTTATATSLNPFGNIDNVTFVATVINSASTTINPMASPAFSELYDTVCNDTIGNRSNLETQWLSGIQQTPNSTWTGSQAWGIIAVELAAATGTYRRLAQAGVG